MCIFALQPCDGGDQGGAPLTDDLRSDGVPPALLPGALQVHGLDGGHGLQVDDGRLHAGPALAGERLAGLARECEREVVREERELTFTLPASFRR